RDLEKTRAEVASWSKRAESALRKSDESAARQALEQKLKASQRLESLERGGESQRAQVEKLQAAYRDLEDRIVQARQRKTLLVARLAQSESARAINNALDRAE